MLLLEFLVYYPIFISCAICFSSKFISCVIGFGPIFQFYVVTLHVCLRFQHFFPLCSLCVCLWYFGLCIRSWIRLCPFGFVCLVFGLIYLILTPCLPSTVSLPLGYNKLNRTDPDLPYASASWVQDIHYSWHNCDKLCQALLFKSLDYLLIW